MNKPIPVVPVPHSLSALLVRNAAANPNGVAYWYGSQSVTWSDLLARSQRVATGLANLGIGAGDRVALWLPNVPEWMVAFFALGRLGAIAVAANTRYRSREIGDIWSRAGVKAVLLWPDYRHIDFPDILGAALHELPALQCLIEYGEEGSGPSTALQTMLSRTARPLQRVAYADLERSAPMQMDAGTLDSPCLTFNTSGTTSKPKIVLHTQGSVLRHGHNVMRGYGFALPDQAVMQMLPFGGTYGFSLAMGALCACTPSAVHHTFDAAVAGQLIRRHTVTRIVMTYDMVNRIYEAEPEKIPFPGLRLFVGVYSHTFATLEKERGFRMQSLYGSSEVQGLYSVQDDVDDPKVRLDPGGVPVAPDAKVRTRSLTDGTILPHGEPGELQFSGPSVFAGYYNDPEATKKALDADGWFSSGDLGFTLADGSFRFMSRIGDALRLSGYLVNPAEIEECIQEIPGVSQCQVVGVELDGATVPVAFYTGDASLDEAAITQHCRNAMARYKVPKRILHLDTFPTVTSANNTKVRRVELRELAQKALGKG